MHALIIEQDSWIILMIEDVLSELGYTSFTIAASLEAAIAAASRRCPDLITSDVRLGSGSGVEAVRQICSERPIPVVFVTATPWEVRHAMAKAVVVPKPFGYAALKDGVTRATAALARQCGPLSFRLGRGRSLRGHSRNLPMAGSERGNHEADDHGRDGGPAGAVRLRRGRRRDEQRQLEPG